jgi:hypothetical protein
LSHPPAIQHRRGRKLQSVAEETPPAASPKALRSLTEPYYIGH